jgi:hypothetical protein
MGDTIDIRYKNQLLSLAVYTNRAHSRTLYTHASEAAIAFVPDSVAKEYLGAEVKAEEHRARRFAFHCR